MTNVSSVRWNAAQTQEQKFWESYAETYERFPQILLEHLAQLRAAGEFITQELRSEKIAEALEVGIGPLGVGVLGMQEPGFRISAVDPLERVSLNILDPALNTYVLALQQKITYQRSQGESLPFDDESFDFVCCHNVIDHAQNPISILENIFRVLKKGRSLYLTLHTLSLLGHMKFELLRKVTPEKMIFVCHPHSFRHVDILRALQKVGFEVARQEGGHSPVFGRGRLSKFVCRKPD